MPCDGQNRLATLGTGRCCQSPVTSQREPRTPMISDFKSTHLHNLQDSERVMFRGARGDFRHHLQQVTLKLGCAITDEVKHTLDNAQMAFMHNSIHWYCACIVSDERSVS